MHGLLDGNCAKLDGGDRLLEVSQATKNFRVGKDTCRYIIGRNMRSNGSLLQIISFFGGLVFFPPDFFDFPDFDHHFKIRNFRGPVKKSARGADAWGECSLLPEVGCHGLPRRDLRGVVRRGSLFVRDIVALNSQVDRIITTLGVISQLGHVRDAVVRVERRGRRRRGK